MVSPDEATISVGFVGSLGRACFSDVWLNACPGRDILYRTGLRRALLAAVAADALHMAIYPGAAEPGCDTLLLCEDRLVVALGAGHALTTRDRIGTADLQTHSLLLPMDGKESDVRRLVHKMAPGLGALGEAPLPALRQRLENSDALALVAESQDELRGAIVTRPIADADTRFPVHLSWSRHAAALGIPALLARQISPPPPPCAINAAGRGQDDAGGGATHNGAGDTVLG